MIVKRLSGFFCLFFMISNTIQSLPHKTLSFDSISKEVSPLSSVASSDLQDLHFPDIAEPQNPCYSLDVLFIVDQSTSMGYVDENNKVVAYSGAEPADPTLQRKSAIDAVIDLLSDMSLDLCPGTKNRIGVISFGSNAQVDLPMSTIAPTDFQESKRIREELQKKVQIYNLGLTQPQLAFEQASQMFANMENIRSGGVRKHVIIFMTDGVPDPAEDRTKYVKDMAGFIDRSFYFDPVLYKREMCLEELRKTYFDLKDAPAIKKDQCLSRNYVEDATFEKSIYLWTVLLESKQPYPPEILTILRKVSEDHGGQLIKLSQNFIDIPATFRDILSRLSGVSATLVRCGKFAVNPALRKATFSIHKNNPALQVSISYKDANDQKHEISGGQQGTNDGFNVIEYNQSHTYEHYVFGYPRPGIWELAADNCDGFDAYYDPVILKTDENYKPKIEPIIPQYEDPPFYDAQKSYPIQYQMIDIFNVTIENSDFPQLGMDINAEITSPSGRVQKNPMTWDKDKKSFVTKDPIDVREIGLYEYTVSGSVKQHTGEPEIRSEDYTEIFPETRQLFFFDGMTFEVSEVKPIQIKLLPIPSEQLNPIHDTLKTLSFPITLSVRPVNLRVQLEYNDGKPIERGGEVIDNTTNAFDTIVQFPDKSTINDVALKQEGDSGVFSSQVENLKLEGMYNVVVNVKPNVNTKSGYRILHSTDSLDFSRNEGNALHRTWFYYTLMAVILALIFIWILYNILIRTNKVRGTLEFLDGGMVLCAFPLYSGKNWTDIRNLERTCPQSGLRSIRVTNFSSNRQKVKVDDDLMPIMPSGSGVHAEYVTISGRRSKIDLIAGNPQIYDDVAFTEMNYRLPE